MLLALGSARALALCGLPLAAYVPLVAAVALLAAHALLSGSRGGTLTIRPDGPWRVDGFARAAFTGLPARSGYRGSAAVVLVLEADAGASASWLGRTPRRRLAIHVDSVSAGDFSLLHFHLALPDRAPSDDASAPASTASRGTKP